VLTFGSLFSGIGGFDLGLEKAGMICKWQCEIDPFCNKVLAKHWPNVKRYGDIKEIGGYNLETVDLICGGFPCQPFSFAGKRRGKKDDRYLWPEMLRVIAEVKPAWVIGENVPGIIHMELDKALSDLEAEGYETQTLIIPACAVDAPHRRDRIWILAYSKTNRDRQFEDSNRHKGNERNCERWEKVGDKSNNCCQDVADANCKRQENYQRGNETERVKRNRAIISCCGAGREYAKWLSEPRVGRVVTRLPSTLDETIKDFGYENSDHQEAITKIDIVRRSILREMWCDQCKIKSTPYRTKPAKNNDSLYEMSCLRAYERWKLGERIKEDEVLCNLWERICAESFQETQNLQQKMFERIRQIECNEKVASSKVDRLKSLGNAVVPQIVEVIGQFIVKIEDMQYDKFHRGSRNKNIRTPGIRIPSNKN